MRLQLCFSIWSAIGLSRLPQGSFGSMSFKRKRDPFVIRYRPARSAGAGMIIEIEYYSEFRRTVFSAKTSEPTITGRRASSCWSSVRRGRKDGEHQQTTRAGVAHTVGDPF